MNQDQNSNEQKNEIPSIFQVPIEGEAFSTNKEESITNDKTSSLIESIPVFDIPNFKDQPLETNATTDSTENLVLEDSVPLSKWQQVEQKEGTIENTIPSTLNVSEEGNEKISDSEEIEMLNPWLAALEAEEEKEIIVSHEVEKPVKVDPVTPHTVEDLIATNGLDTKKLEDNQKKVPWKFLVIAFGVIATIILIVIVVAIINKAGNRTLSCSLEDTNEGILYRTVNTFVFKGKNMDTLGTKVEYRVVDHLDHTTELMTMKTVMQYMDEKIKSFSGTKTELKATNEAITYDITLEHEKVKLEQWKPYENEFVDVTALEYFNKDYNTIKKELSELNYICK